MTARISMPGDLEGASQAQLAAMSTRPGRWIAVRAGAGSGKTRVLVSRMLLLLEQGVPLERIVAITFTRKAAAEMSTRVANALDRRISELRTGSPAPDLAEMHKLALERLERSRREFSRRRIGTIDAMCMRILSEHTFEAGLEPGFELLADGEQESIREQAAALVVRNLSAQLIRNQGQTPAHPAHPPSPELQALFDLYDVMSEGQVKRVLVATLASAFELERALAPWDRLATPQAIARYVEWISQRAQAQHAARIRELDILGRVERACAAAQGVAKTTTIESDDNLRYVQTLASILTEGRIRPEHAVIPSRKRQKKVWDEAGFASTEITRLKNDCSAILEQTAFDAAEEERGARVFAALGRLLPVLVAAHSECKGRRLDYADLKTRALALLADAHIRDRVARGMEYLMIDEFQDTDPLQWEMVERLLATRNINLFIVGDEKQSIYRFRGADVTLFRRACEVVARHNQTSGEDGPALHPWTHAPLDHLFSEHAGIITLAENYRSLRAPLESGNLLFQRLFAKSISGEAVSIADFEARPDPLIVRRNDPERGQLELVPVALEGEEEDDDGEGGYASSAEQAQADAVAEYLHTHFHAGGKGLAWGAMAVLVDRNSAVEAVRDALIRRGIPCRLAGARRLFARQECLDLWALCATLADPHEDLACAALLRSPLIGVSDEGLTLLCRQKSEAQTSLVKRWQAALNDAAFAPQDHRCLGEGWRRVQKLLGLVGRIPLVRLLERGLSESGWWAQETGTMRAQRAANMNQLLQLAQQHELQTGSHPAAFAEWLRAHIVDAHSGQGALAEEGVVRGQGMGVSVMTIHAAKGLEFEAVLLSHLGARRNQGDEGAFRLERAAEGKPALLGIRMDDPAQPKAPGTFGYRELARQARREQAAELRRLLYVGWTRARNRLAVMLPVLRTKEPKPIDLASDLSSLAQYVLGAFGMPPLTDKTMQQAHQAWGDHALAHIVPDLHPGLRLCEVMQPPRLKLEPSAGQTALLDGCHAALGMQYPVPCIDNQPVRFEEQPWPEERISFAEDADESGADGDGAKEAARIFGIVVHRVLERALTVDDAGLEGLCRHAWRRAGFHHPREEDVARALGQVRKVKALLGVVDPSAAAVECELSFRVGDQTFTRRLDLAFESEPGHWHICDYKTGSERPEYRRQLEEHAVALRAWLRACGQKPLSIETAIVLTDRPERKRMGMYGDQEIDELERRWFMTSPSASSSATGG